MVAEQLQSSQPVLANLVSAGKLNVVAAYYDLASGNVSILS
jgi:carbonic anhydrase